jgi:hypothetical protein
MVGLIYLHELLVNDLCDMLRSSTTEFYKNSLATS